MSAENDTAKDNMLLHGCKRSYDAITKEADAQIQTAVELRKPSPLGDDDVKTAADLAQKLCDQLQGLKLSHRPKRQKTSNKKETTVIELFSSVHHRKHRKGHVRSKLGRRTADKRACAVFNASLAHETTILNISEISLVAPHQPYPHQVQSAALILDYELHGMPVKHFSKTGGILTGSQAGLGKTLIQLLVFVATLELQRKLQRPTLIVTQKHLIGQLKEQVQLFFGNRFTVGIYHSEFEKINHWIAGAYVYDLLITNYSTVTSQCKGKHFNYLFHTTFHRVIFDEIHILRKVNACHKACLALNATHRHGMSGTIIHETLRDLVVTMFQLGLDPSVLAKGQRISKKWVEDSHILRRVIQNTFQKTQMNLPPCVVRCLLSTDGINLVHKMADRVDSPTYAMKALTDTKCDVVVKYLSTLAPADKMLLFFRSNLAALTFAKRCPTDLQNAIVFFESQDSAKHVYEQITTFRSCPEKRFLCLSYRLGSVGFNLTEANHVGLVQGHSSDCILTQSISRSIQIRQQRNVTIVFFATEGSTEETKYTEMLPTLHYLYPTKHDNKEEVSN